jgi:hypothetical protein
MEFSGSSFPDSVRRNKGQDGSPFPSCPPPLNGGEMSERDIRHINRLCVLAALYLDGIPVDLTKSDLLALRTVPFWAMVEAHYKTRKRKTPGKIHVSCDPDELPRVYAFSRGGASNMDGAI